MSIYDNPKDKVVSDMVYKASEWWKEQLCRTDPEQFIEFPQDRDKSAIFIIANIFKGRIPKKDLRDFSRLLESEIMRCFKKEGSVELYTKKWPCELLEHVGNIVGISGSDFPWFLWMKIEKYKITVKAGKDVAEEVIFFANLAD